jgi:hypothetical protein
MLMVLMTLGYNSIFTTVLKTQFKDKQISYEELSKSSAHEVRNKVEEVIQNGMIIDHLEQISMFRF